MITRAKNINQAMVFLNCVFKIGWLWLIKNGPSRTNANPVGSFLTQSDQSWTSWTSPRQVGPVLNQPESVQF